MHVLARRTTVLVFLAFAFAYFLSALVRAITATLSPTLSQEFALSAGSLGLLAGGYFLGFAAMQLPLGRWLDRFGPKHVILGFLGVAVLGCLAFSVAHSFAALLAARVLTGVGVGACLMAPLTGYRRWLEPGLQLRANSWMLMTGSLGMVAATLPVQWLMPLLGWRALFWGLAGAILLAMALIVWLVPRWSVPAVDAPQTPSGLLQSYAPVWANRYFRSLVPLGFFSYGGLVAMQTLWAAPWMVKVAGYSALEAATGMFWINLSMLCSFWLWGMVNPWLARRGLHADRLIALGLPLSFVFLGLLVVFGPVLGGFSAAAWALFCVGSTFVSLAQPAVAMAFPAALAGRALSAYNLVIFLGVFVVQWGVGLSVDGFKRLGLGEIASFQCAMAAFLLCSVASYGYFLLAKPHNQAQ
jgi:predicted MFS family arabinose efflux permease